MSAKYPVAVIGAGPVGLFTALLLAKKGIKVNVYESGKGIDQSPRAVAYFPPVLEEFAKAGIIADVIEAGEKVSDGCDWKDPDGNVLAGINPPPSNPTFAVVLSQPEICEVFLRNLLATGNATVIFNESFTRLEQGNDNVSYWTLNQARDEEVKHECQYLVGADGGRSGVRRSLGLELQGFTFETLQFVAINFQYPLSDLGWKAANFIVDPIDWGIVVKRGKGTSWRFASGVTKSNSDMMTVLDEATIQLVKKRLLRILPGDKSKLNYESMAPYRVHQRCASHFRKGRVLLAGDAAHLNNPVGGLGLTTGLLDAAHLSNALTQVINEKVDSSVLTSYAETRRRIFLERTSPLSLANLRRLHSQDPLDVKKRAEDFANLNNPKDFINATRIGLPDFALTSTSNRIFDTQKEMTWFISVTKIPDWTDDKFVHEYKTVHAGMTQKTGDGPKVVQRYIQLANSAKTIEGTEQVPWNYVTCLTMPSLFIAHAGFSDPGYKATAGAHVFCRLDQQGCLTTEVTKVSKGNSKDKSDVGALQCLLFHKRKDASDEYSETWYNERATKWTDIAASDSRLHTYILYRDVTPKDTDYFFRDTQFSGGSWGDYKAVEAFHFLDETISAAFFKQYRDLICESSHGGKHAVVGVPDIVI